MHGLYSYLKGSTLVGPFLLFCLIEPGTAKTPVENRGILKEILILD